MFREKIKQERNLLFASGQVPLSPETGEIIGETIQEQAEQVLKNIGAILEEAGTDFDHVVKTTCFLKWYEWLCTFVGSIKQSLPQSFQLDLLLK